MVTVNRTFAARCTQELYSKRKTRKFPPDMAPGAARKPDYVDLATSLDDLAEGIPYQTLVASILHKYVEGRLHEER